MFTALQTEELRFSEIEERAAFFNSLSYEEQEKLLTFYDYRFDDFDTTLELTVYFSHRKGKFITIF